MGFIESIMSLFISKDVNKLKKSEDWKNLDNQYSKNQREIEHLEEKKQEQLKQYKVFEANAKLKGYPVMSYAKFKKLAEGPIAAKKKSNYKGDACSYCNNVISTNTAIQFCSVKCEKEYRDFKKKK